MPSYINPKNYSRSRRRRHRNKHSGDEEEARYFSDDSANAKHPNRSHRRRRPQLNYDSDADEDAYEVLVALDDEPSPREQLVSRREEPRQLEASLRFTAEDDTTVDEKTEEESTNSEAKPATSSLPLDVLSPPIPIRPTIQAMFDNLYNELLSSRPNHNTQADTQPSSPVVRDAYTAPADQDEDTTEEECYFQLDQLEFHISQISPIAAMLQGAHISPQSSSTRPNKIGYIAHENHDAQVQQPASQTVRASPFAGMFAGAYVGPVNYNAAKTQDSQQHQQIRNHTPQQANPLPTRHTPIEGPLYVEENIVPLVERPRPRSVWRGYNSGYQNCGNIDVNHYRRKKTRWFNMELCYDHFLVLEGCWYTDEECKWRHTLITCGEQLNMKDKFVRKVWDTQKQRKAEVDGNARPRLELEKLDQYK